MKFYNSNNLEGFYIDGKMSEAEKKFNPQNDEWRLVTGPQGTMINATFWDRRFREQGEITAYYSDDVTVTDPPEDIPGNFGAFGTRARFEKLKHGDYYLLAAWYLPPREFAA